MKHAGIEAGCVSTSLASRPLPPDPRHVNHNPHITFVLVVADIRLPLGHHDRPLEKVLAPVCGETGYFCKWMIIITKVSNIVNFNYAPFASINPIMLPIRLVPTYWTIISRNGVGLRRYFVL